MTDQREIKFPEKKVDQDWKNTVVAKEAPQASTGTPPSATPQSASSHPPKQEPSNASTNKVFMSLISSLGYQTLYHLGEVSDPSGLPPEVNLEGAREAIQILMAIQEKTKGNLSRDEERMLVSLLAELQMKYAGKA